jgi:hypothetical protein
MLDKAYRFVVLSQASAFGFLLICVALLPKYLFARNEGGISNYGVHRLTVIPFTLAFLGCSLFIFKAAQAMPRQPKTYKLVRRLLLTLGVLQLLLMASTYPYQLNTFLGDLHLLVQSILFVSELVAGGWLALGLAGNTSNRLLFACQVCASVLLLLTLAGNVHVLFVAQLLNQASFGLILIRVLAFMESTAQ